MSGTRAFVAMAGGKGRSYLEYFLANKTVAVGWGRYGHLYDLRKQCKTRTRKHDPVDDNLATNVLKPLLRVRGGDFVFLARWPIVGRVSCAKPYSWNPKCTIGGWDLFHQVHVDSWRIAPNKEWETLINKRWIRGRAFQFANVPRLDEVERRVDRWNAIEGDALPDDWSEAELYALLDKTSHAPSKRLYDKWKSIYGRKKPKNENEVREKIVKPFLEKVIAGSNKWKKEEHEIDLADLCPSCGQPRVLVEVKRKGGSLYTEGLQRQIRRYVERAHALSQSLHCKQCTEKIAILTNGGQWRFFSFRQSRLIWIADLHMDEFSRENSKIWSSTKGHPAGLNFK